MKKRNGLAALIAGLGLGVGVGLLIAPKSGEETRKDLKVKMDDLVNYLKGLDYNEVKDNMIEKVENLKKELEDLDKEKVMEVAKEKAELIKNKAQELYESALQQGKPAVEKAAKEIKAQTVVVLKNTIDKLEKDENSSKKETKTVTKKSPKKE